MADVFNDAQLDDDSTLLKSSMYTMLGPFRPPAHNRKLWSESLKVGIMAISPLVSYRLCVTHSFAPLFLPSVASVDGVRGSFPPRSTHGLTPRRNLPRQTNSHHKSPDVTPLGLSHWDIQFHLETPAQLTR